uniref:Uncharacterized protein n=1 Tax=Glossina austeni TaxID=7395 RepID=A0A1A9V6N1_GLOAU
MSFFRVPMRMFLAYGMQLYPMSPGERVSTLQKLAFCNFAAHIAVHIFLAPMYQIKHPPVLVKEFTDTVVLLVFFFLAIIRFTMVITKREQVKQIVEKMNRYFPKTMEDQKIYGVEIYYKELIRVLKIFTICLSVSCTLYCVEPYLTLLTDHLKGRPASFQYQ